MNQTAKFELLVPTKEDAKAIARLHERTVIESYSEDYDTEALNLWSKGHTSERWEKLLTNPDFMFAIAREEKQIIGCCGLNLKKKRLGVYVHPKHHRKGIGKNLAEYQLLRAREKGIETLELSAPQKAVSFYESIGGQVIGRAQHEFSPSKGIEVFNMIIPIKNLETKLGFHAIPQP